MGSTCPTTSFEYPAALQRSGAACHSQNHETDERSLDLLKWGLIPSWIKDPKNRPKPINAMSCRELRMSEAATTNKSPMNIHSQRQHSPHSPIMGGTKAHTLAFQTRRGALGGNK